MTAARFFTVQSIAGHQHTYFDKVDQTESLFKFYVQFVYFTRDAYVGPEVFFHFLDTAQSFLQRFFGTSHTYKIPHDVTQFLVDGVNRVFTVNGFDFLNLILDSFFGCYEFRKVGRETRNLDLIGQIVLDSVWQYEISVGQTLHQRGCTQTVGTVIGEVGFADSEQTRNRSHQFIIYPNTTHCVVDSGEYHHRSFIWILVGDFFVHIEEVTITGTNHILTQTIDGIFEIKENGQAGIVYTETCIATFFGST